jgi:hypothetical protein
MRSRHDAATVQLVHRLLIAVSEQDRQHVQRVAERLEDLRFIVTVGAPST